MERVATGFQRLSTLINERSNSKGVPNAIRACLVDCEDSFATPICLRYGVRGTEFRMLDQDDQADPTVFSMAVSSQRMKRYSGIKSRWEGLPLILLSRRDDFLMSSTGAAATEVEAMFRPTNSSDLAAEVKEWLNGQLPYIPWNDFEIPPEDEFLKLHFHMAGYHWSDRTENGCFCIENYTECTDGYLFGIGAGCTNHRGCDPDGTCKTHNCLSHPVDQCIDHDMPAPPLGYDPSVAHPADAHLALIMLIHFVLQRHAFETRHEDRGQTRRLVLVGFLQVLCAIELPVSLGLDGEQCRQSMCELLDMATNSWDEITVSVTVQWRVGESVQNVARRMVDWLALEKRWRYCGKKWSWWGKLGWQQCLGSSFKTRGLFCGIWVFLHMLLQGQFGNRTLRTFAHPLDPLTGGETLGTIGTVRALRMAHDFLLRFFECRECRERIQDIPFQEKDIADHKGAVLWLWRAHSDVTAGIINERRDVYGGDLEYPKQPVWPTPKLCPECATGGDDAVYAFLCRFYSGGHQAHSNLKHAVEHWDLETSSSGSNNAEPPERTAWIESRSAAILAGLGAAAAGLAAIMALRASPACSVSTSGCVRRRSAQKIKPLLRTCSVDARTQPIAAQATTTRENQRTLLLSPRECEQKTRPWSCRY
eukprot:gnl/MRDRNA2_/MRDRNA2_85181_c0_seq1.p1 gnl/MRDRNA2_/MRDRNA2_85181_c0~~gnl/MRDRNA2_/MRDRNA2_85181_c0_seq1.p1  ORF type:complete len:687 (-),score=103.85 gnl/MRDRNA2_/MRDRNA2_85181_c0_seq1:181-2124(-)